MTTSTLQLACPTCGRDITIGYELDQNCRTKVVSLSRSRFCPTSMQEAYDLLMDYAARQAELATERAGERG